MHFALAYADQVDSPADRLRRARVAAGFETAAAAATALGVAVATYGQHENGLRGIPATKAEKYARRFRVAPEWLLYGRGEDPLSPSPAEADRRRTQEHIGNTPDLPDPPKQIDYVEVEVLPTHAGMGGGGTGDGDQRTALMPRSLVEAELHARAADLLLINVRGDSMEPRFENGDQLLIDRRDTNPRQPGPFALWYDDGYMVKNIEIIRSTGKLRVFSTNPVYSDDYCDPADVRIMGRPVWLGRRI